MPLYDPSLTHVISGNTAGATALISEGTYVLAGGNNITLSQAGNSVTISGGAGGAGDGGNILAAGTRTAGSNSSVLFSNLNGVTFGLDAVNGSVMTASVVTTYLTTAMASNRGSDFVQATAAFAGTSASGTIASNGISVSIGPYITTAALSNHSHGASGANGSFAFQTLSFSNAQGVSFATSAGSAIVGSVETSYAASNHSHGNPQLNLTNLSGTTASNSAGFTLSLSAGAGGAGDGGNILAAGTRTAGSNSSVLWSNSNGLTFGLDAVAGSVMTAIYTVPTLTNSSMTVSDAATSGTLARLAFTNLNGVTLSLSSGAAGLHTIVGSHNALTTARASTDAIGLNTAQTNVTWTVNSSGLSFNAGGYAGTTTGFGGTNISGSMTHNTLGLNISLSVAAPVTKSLLFPMDFMGTLTGQMGQSSVFVIPLQVPENLIVSRANAFVSMSISTSSNSSHVGAISLHFGLYTRNVSTLSLATSGSAANSWTNTSNNSTSVISGLRMISAPLAATLTPGDYWLAVMSRTGTTNANWFTASNWLGTLSNVAYSGPLGVAVNATHQVIPGWGMFSVQSANIPASIAFNAITGTTSGSAVVPIVNFVNFTA